MVLHVIRRWPYDMGWYFGDIPLFVQGHAGPRYQPQDAPLLHHTFISVDCFPAYTRWLHAMYCVLSELSQAILQVQDKPSIFPC
jgi:hypothetical protein